MLSLEQIQDEIKSEVKVDKNGIGVATISGTARLVDVSKQGLSKTFASDNISGSKLLQMLVMYGFEPSTFAEKGVPDLAVAIIAKYYAYFAGARCTELAKRADLAFSGIGVRAWFQELVGWSNTSLTTCDDEVDAILTALLDTRRQLKETREQQTALKTEIDQIKQKQIAAEKAFVTAPPPEVVTPAMEVRMRINRIVRDFCFTTGCEHHFAWRQLYREFRDLYHIDLSVRAKNNRHSKLDECESLGMLKDLYAVAYQLFGEIAQNG